MGTSKQAMRKRSSVDGVDTAQEGQERQGVMGLNAQEAGGPLVHMEGAQVSDVIGLRTQAWRLLVHRRGA